MNHAKERKNRRFGTKAISFFLSLVMVLSLIPATSFTVLAAGEVASVNGANYATVQEAIDAASSGDTVTLIDDVTMTGETRFIVSGKSIKLDLGGHVISGENRNLIDGLGSRLDVIGPGTVTSEKDHPFSVVNGGYLTIGSGVNVSYTGTGADDYQCAVFFGKGGGTLVTEGDLSTTGGEASAIGANGSSGYGPNYCTVNGGSVKSATYAAIYWTKNSDLTINGGLVEGAVGIAAKAGTVTINGGEVRGTAPDADPIEGAFSDGIVISGAAVQLESNASYDGNVVLNITGGSVISENGNAVYAYSAFGNPDEIDAVNITGGTLECGEGMANIVTSEDAVEQKVTVGEDAVFVGSVLKDGKAIGADGKITVSYSAALKKTGEGEVTFTLPDIDNIAEGQKVAFTVAPADGYAVSEVKAAGESYSVNCDFDGTEYSFTMPAEDVEVSVVFAEVPQEPVIPSYVITTDILPSDSGTITLSGEGYDDASGEAQAGSAVKAVVTPNDGYYIKNLTVSDVEGNFIDVYENLYGEFTFTMPEKEVTVTAEIEEIPLNKVTVKYYNYDNELIDSLYMDESGSFNLRPAPEKEGYSFTGWELYVDGVREDVYGAGAEFSLADFPDAEELNFIAVMSEIVKADHVISKEETKDGVTTSGDDIDLGAVVTAKEGETVTFTVNVDEGYTVSSVNVYDDNTGSGLVLLNNKDGSYSFVMPDSDVTISVVLESADDSVQVKVIYKDRAGDIEKEVDGLTSGQEYIIENPEDADGFIAYAGSDGSLYLAGEEYVLGKEDLTLTPMYQVENPVYVVTFRNPDGSINAVKLATKLNRYAVETPTVDYIKGYDVENAKWDGGNVAYAQGITVNGIDSDTEFVLDAKRIVYNIDSGVQVIENDDYITEGDGLNIAWKAHYDEKVLFWVDEKEGYQIERVTVSADPVDEFGGTLYSYAVPVSEGPYDPDVRYYSFDMPDADVYVEVVYRALPVGTHIVKFISDGVLADYFVAAEGTEITAPEAPEKAGAEFKGWNSGNTVLNAGDGYKITSDAPATVVFEAEWTLGRGKIHYNCNGGLPDYPDAYYDYGEIATLEAAPEREGYKFVGWLNSEDGLIYNPGAKYSAPGVDVDFTAQWDTEGYIVKFVNKEAGTIAGYETVDYNGTVNAPAAPVRTGFSFDKWVDADNENNVVSAGGVTNPITKDTTYIASWTGDKYSVTVDSPNASLDPAPSGMASYGDTISFKVTPNEKYQVTGVSVRYTENGSSKVEPVADVDGEYSFNMPASDVVITVATEKNVFNVTLNPDNHSRIELGTDPLTYEIEAGQGVSFNVEVDEGYQLESVFVTSDSGYVPVTVLPSAASGKEYSFTMPKSDSVINATTVPIQNKYTVTYLDEDNTLLKQDIVDSDASSTAKNYQTLTYESAAQKDVRDGYTFDKWTVLMADLSDSASVKSYNAAEEIYVGENIFLKASLKGIDHTVTAGIKDNVYMLQASLAKDMNSSVNLLNSETAVLNYASTGKTVYLDVAARFNYKISDITVSALNGDTDIVVTPVLLSIKDSTDADGNAVKIYRYSFAMPNSDVAVNVYTQPQEYRVTVTENPEDAGTVTINGTVTDNMLVAQDDEVVIKVKPAAGYGVESISAVYQNGRGEMTQIADLVNTDENTWKFTMVPFAVSVDIEYVPLTYTVDVTTGNAETFRPGIAGAASDPIAAAEDLDVDNKGYVVLMNGESQIVDDNDMDAVYSPSNAEFSAGTKVKFKAVAYRGWVLNEVHVTSEDGTNGLPVAKKDGYFYFNMPADSVEIKASFVKADYLISAKVSAGKGTVTVNDKDVSYDESEYKAPASVTAVPEDGYYVQSIEYTVLDGAAQKDKFFGDASVYTGAMNVNDISESRSVTFFTPSSKVLYDIRFAPIDYSIDSVNVADGIENPSTDVVNDTEGGTITLDANTANTGDQVTVEVSPKYGYKLTSLSVLNADGKKVASCVKDTEPENGGLYFFTMPAEPVTVRAEFKKVDYVVTYLNYDNTVIGMEGVVYRGKAAVDVYADKVTVGKIGHHFVGWTSEDTQTPQTAPSLDPDDFVIVKDTEIVAQYEADKTDIVLNTLTDGHCDVDGVSYTTGIIKNSVYGDTVTLTLVPNTGFVLDELTISTHLHDNMESLLVYEETVLDDNSVEVVFKVPATYKDNITDEQSEDIVVNAVFTENEYVLSERNVEDHGTVEINGINVTDKKDYIFNYNDNVSINITPDKGYYVYQVNIVGYDGIDVIPVDGTSMPAMDTPRGETLSLNFKMPAQDAVYDIRYAKIDYSISTDYDDTQGTIDVSDKAQIDDVVPIRVVPKKGYALESITVTYDDGKQTCELTGTGTDEFVFNMPAAPVLVKAVFKEVTYTAYLKQTGSGKVTFDTYYTGQRSADYLDTVVIGAVPDAGWSLNSIVIKPHISSVGHLLEVACSLLVAYGNTDFLGDEGEVDFSPDIVPEGGEYSFTMPNSDVDVAVEFVKNTYGITVIDEPEEGGATTASASSANVGDVIRLAVEPEEGYVLDSIQVTYEDGEKSCALTRIGNNKYTFTMPADDVTVKTVYVEDEYNVTLNKSGQGVVRLDGHDSTRIKASYKDTVTVSVVPAEGWKLSSIKAANGSVELVTGADGEYTFIMPNEDISVDVLFERIENEIDTFAITAKGEGHGEILVGTNTAKVGETVTFTLDPDDGYRVKEASVFDSYMNPVTTAFVIELPDHSKVYTFTMPADSVLVVGTFEVEGSSYYVDVRSDDWYYDAVTDLTDRGIFVGVTPDKFGPNIPMTRAMMAMIFARLEDVDLTAYEGQNGGFPDVDPNRWFAEAVAWAADTGVVTGYLNDGTFKPDKEITREEMFTMMYRYAKYKGYDTTVKNPEFLDRYIDAEETSKWAKDALIWCVSTGISKGYAPAFVRIAPKDTAPRSHAAQMFKNYLDKVVYE